MDENLSQMPPHNREAEEAVLGAVLIDPLVFDELAELLRPEHFYIVRGAWIWQAFTRLRERGTPLDLLTGSNELEQHGHLAEAGGPAYLISLINRTPSSLNAAAYAQMVRDTALQRAMARAAGKVASAAYHQPFDPAAALDEAEQAVFALGQVADGGELLPAAEVMSRLYDQVAEQARGGRRGLPTGFTDLDALLGGLHPSDLVITGARPGMGKTSFLITLALHAAQAEKKHVAFFSLEMSAEQLGLRMAAQEAGIDSQRLRTGRLQEGEPEKFARAIESLSRLSLYVDDTPALTPALLRSRCRRLRMQRRLDLVVLDYIQMMSCAGRFENRVQEVGYISRQLKVLARELDVPVLAAAQLSRAVEQRADKRPLLSDLRESGSLEMDADVVMFLHRTDNPLTRGLTELHVAKHRQGPTGLVRLTFQEALTRFVNASWTTGTVDKTPWTLRGDVKVAGRDC